MKKKGFRVFSLPAFPTILIVAAAAALLVYVFWTETEGALAYIAYLLSTYALIVGVSGLCRLFPWIGQRFKSSRLMTKLHENERLARYLDDPVYRTQLTLFFSVAVNAVYIGVKLVSGLYARSNWLIAFALYYVVLTALRVSLVNYVRRHEIGTDITAEYRRYRWIGFLLLAMNLVLSIIIARMVGHNDAYVYPGVLIYAMAAYTFYAIILATVNVFRFRRHGSPVLSAIKVVSLTAAMVAMLSLEAAMLAQFGADDDPTFRGTMLGVSGLVVSLIILGMAVYMIVNANKKMKSREAKANE